MRSSHFFAALAAFVLLLQAPAWSGDEGTGRGDEETGPEGTEAGMEEQTYILHGAGDAPEAGRQDKHGPATAYGTRASGDFTVGDTDVEYAVIAPASFKDALSPLLKWKTHKGVPAKAYYLEDIEAGTGGKDRAEKVRNHLVSLASVSDGLRWVLLAGDHDVIPARMIYTGADAVSSSYASEYASDYYFAGLDGSWNDDGDSRWGEDGETDWEADVFVGRLPVNTPSELSTCVDRILSYERSPPAGDWTSRALLCGGLMDIPNAVDDAGTPGVDEGYNEYKDNAFKAMLEVLPSIPGDITVSQYYDYPFNASGEYSPSTDTYRKSTFPGIMDEGWSVVDIAGQAFYSDNTVFGNSLAEYVDPAGLNRTFNALYSHEDVYGMGNGDARPLMILISCDVGKFTEKDDTNFEKALYAPDGGAIGLISSTGVSYRGETEMGSYGNWWANERFMEIFYGDGRAAIEQPGKALYRMKEEYAAEIYRDGGGYGWSIPEAVKSNLVGYNLLGDPELHVWSGEVGGLDMTRTPDPLYSGRVSVTLGVNFSAASSGGPASGVRVTLSAPGAAPGGVDVWVSGKTDATGEISFQTDVEGDAQLTAVAFIPGYLPAELGIPITVEPADLTFQNDPAATPAVPNEDEEFAVNATVLNRGDTASPASAITIRSADGSVEDSTAVPPLEPGENATVGFLVTLTGGNHSLELALDPPGGSLPQGSVAESREGNNMAGFDIHVNFLPVFSSFPELTMDEDTLDTNLLNLSTYVSDPDGPQDGLTLSVTEGHPLVTIGLTSGRYIRAEATGDFSGEVNFTLTASDGLGETDALLLLSVIGTNDPPVPERPGQLPALENSPFQYPFSAYDAEGDNLTYALEVTSTQGPISGDDVPVIDPVNGTITFTPGLGALLASPINVTVTVTDIHNETAWSAFSIVITDVPEPPGLVTGGEYRARVGERFTAVLQGRDNDLASGSQTEGLTFTSDRSFIDFRSLNTTAAEMSFTPSRSHVGQLTVVVTVSDGTHTSNHTVTIRVREEAKDGSALMTAVAGGAAVLLIIVLLALLVRARRKGRPVDGGETQSPGADVDEGGGVPVTEGKAAGSGQREEGAVKGRPEQPRAKRVIKPGTGAGKRVPGKGAPAPEGGRRVIVSRKK